MRACLRPCRERLGDVEREGRECARWRWRLRWRSREAAAVERRRSRGGGNGSSERSRERNEWRDSAAAADAAALAEAAGASSCDRRSVHFCFSSRSLSVSLSLFAERKKKEKTEVGVFPSFERRREKKKCEKKTSSTLLALFFFSVFLPLCSLFSPRHPAPPRAWNPSADFAWRAVKRTELFSQVRPLAKKQAQRARRRAPAGGVGEGHLKRKTALACFFCRRRRKVRRRAQPLEISCSGSLVIRPPSRSFFASLSPANDHARCRWERQRLELEITRGRGHGKRPRRKSENGSLRASSSAARAERKEKCKLFIPR